MGRKLIFSKCLFGGTLNIAVVKAVETDAQEIFDIQVICFKPLLEKYQDYETNPANEKLEQVEERIRQYFTDYYIIKANGKSVGGIRIQKMENGKRCRISPIFILPDYQNQGIAQIVFKKIEELYMPEHGWELDTILEERGNCYLYEKMGYTQTGETKKINDKLTLVFYEKQGIA